MKIKPTTIDDRSIDQPSRLCLYEVYAKTDNVRIVSIGRYACKYSSLSLLAFLSVLRCGGHCERHSTCFLGIGTNKNNMHLPYSLPPSPMHAFIKTTLHLRLCLHLHLHLHLNLPSFTQLLSLSPTHNVTMRVI